MIRTLKLLLPIVFLIAGDFAAADARGIREERVQFSPGATGTVVRDRIVGREVVDYIVRARVGQTMTVSLRTDNSSNYFNLLAPRETDVAYFIGSTSGNSHTSRLRRNGDYRIRVYLMSNAARRGERARYTLNISVSGSASQLPGGGQAEADAPGEPMYWRVSGLGSGQRLNVRNGPSVLNRVLYKLRSGEVVRNRGCDIQYLGTRWCRIDRVDRPGHHGWAAARYLSPAHGSGGGATQLPGDGHAAGGRYDATGSIRCTLSAGAPTRICSFGVIRRGRGDATVVVQLPRSGERRIVFEAGRPVSSNSKAGVYAEWRGDNVDVFIGTEEQYVVPDAVLWGG